MHVTCIDSKSSLFKRRNLFTCVNVADVELRLDAGGRPVKFNSKLSDVDVMNSIQLTHCRFTPLYSEQSITSQILAQSSSPSAARYGQVSHYPAIILDVFRVHRRGTSCVFFGNV